MARLEKLTQVFLSVEVREFKSRSCSFRDGGMRRVWRLGCLVRVSRLGGLAAFERAYCVVSNAIEIGHETHVVGMRGLGFIH